DWGKPLHLIMKGTNWLNGTTGIEIEEGVLKSATPARKVVEAIRESSQMTVEVWISTDNVVQSGPARIVSLSDGPDHRNFTLGQVGKDIHFRVSTPRTGSNGSRIHLIAQSVLNDLQTHHFVATFNRGVERLIVDGSPVEDIIRGDMDYLPDLFGLGRNPIAQSAFCFVFVFPLSFIAYGLFRKNHLLFTLMAVMGLVNIIEMIYYTKFGQPFGYLFFFISFFTTLFGCLIGYILKKN
ncbi:LamG domain-containing protein, partial [bacterium]|nr:LamG domain-containing protein [bacterium]